MLAEEIMLLYFLLSRLSYFRKRVKYQVMWHFRFFVSVTISQMRPSLFFSSSICHLFTWILHFLSRLTFYSWKDNVSSFSLEQYPLHVLEAEQSTAGLF